MPIFDIFSKRQARRNPPTVVVFDEFPQHLRQQLLRIFVRAIGEHTEPTWTFIANALRDEWGKPVLGKSHDLFEERADINDVLQAFQMESDVDRVLDIAELCLRVIDRLCRGDRWMNEHRRYNSPSGPEQTPDSAIEESNIRMREAGVGYRYAEGAIIRVDSEFGYQENVLAPLTLLVEQDFQGAEGEFLAAHLKYRHGDYPGSMAEAVKSLESTLKTICEKKGWTDKIGRSQVLPERAALKELVIYVVKVKCLITSRAQNFFDGLVKTLEDGAGPLRNQAGGAHGAGPQPVSIKDYEAAYCLGITGAAIRLLVDAYKDSS